MNKEWRKCDTDDCKDCGSGLHVLTNAPKGYIEFGDKVVCSAGCGRKGWVLCDKQGTWILWDEETITVH